MSFRATRALVLAVLCCGAAAARGVRADDGPTPAVPTPEERAEKVLAGLPAPSASEPWVFEADVFINDSPMGSARFTLTPVKEGEADLWEASDGVRIGPLEDPVVTLTLDAVVDARLTGLHGKTVSASKGQPTITFGWRRTPMGYGLERQEGEAPAEKVLLKEATVLKATLGGMVRFCRALPAEPATYAVRVLSQDPNLPLTPEVRIQETVVEVQGVKPFKIGGVEREAWVVRRTYGKDEEAYLAFEPKDRRLLAVTTPARRTEIVRKGLEMATKPEAGAIDWKAPAKSPEVAALQAGRAFATGDVEALERVTWWPSAGEVLKQDPQLGALDDEARKAAFLAGLKKTLPSNPAPMIELALQGAHKQLVVEDAGEGRKRVKFPPMFRSLVLVVMEVEGTWYLAEFPIAAPPAKEPPPSPPATPETPK